MGCKPVAIVTGCSSGLGFALAKRLVREGYIVYAGMRDLKQKEKLFKACQESKFVMIRYLDLLDNPSMERVVEEVISTHQKIDLLINNAATAILGPPDCCTPEEVEYQFKVNVFSLVRLCQLVLPQMRKQKSGHILTVGSISSIESSSYLGVYSATKFAQEALMLSWSTILHRWNIRCTMLEAGAMNTNLPHSIESGGFYKEPAEDPYLNFNERSLGFLKEILGKGKNPDEVADLVIEILNSPDPHFRYSSCEFSQNILNKHLKDPEGDAWIQEHRHFVDKLYRKL